MSNILNKRDIKVKNNLSKSDTYFGWDAAIADIKKRIKGLESTLDFFERRQRAGEPWPGDKKAGTEAESIPA
jgi:hypothetical protein